MTDALYAQVQEPAEFRRGLLQSSKSIIDCLKQIEQYKLARADRKELHSDLNRQTAQLSRLVNRLKNALPRTDLKPKQPKAVKPVVPAEPKPVVQKTPRKSKIEELESELSRIEAKLGTLE